VRYDLDAVRAGAHRDDLAERPHTMWRYRELLPVDDDAAIVSLGETMTPIVPCPRLGAAIGASNLHVKDESRLPTGSFKARGMAMAVSMARQLGVSRVAVPTAGNAGGALAAYAARAGMECFVFMPEDTPVVNRYEVGLHGGRAFLVNGLINDCGRAVREGAEAMGWFDMSTLKEPYRIEGKKTMGLELAEQMAWNLPDVILYPTGGGTGLIGMWKAFEELGALGWLETEGRPRLFSCQSSGCPPIATAFDAGERFATAPESPHTCASGLRVPAAVGDFMILDAVRASGGRAMSADEDRLADWMRLACATEGIALCPESAACIGVLERALAEGHIDPDENIVLFNTGAAQKYVEVMKTDLPRLDVTTPIDWTEIARLSEPRREVG
jgi:threonine synthase